jgi:hypothetical protein
MTRRDFISLLGAAVTLCSTPTPGQQLGTAMTVASKRATATIPIVMAPVADPLRAGIVTNLAHPGGNVTGTALRFGACGQARGRFQASGSGDLAHRRAWRRGEPSDPSALARDAECSSVAEVGGASIYGARSRRTICDLRDHRAG